MEQLGLPDNYEILDQMFCLCRTGKKIILWEIILSRKTINSRRMDKLGRSDCLKNSWLASNLDKAHTYSGASAYNEKTNHS